MAKSKTNQQTKQKTILIKPRKILENELLERISIGEELNLRNIQDRDQLNKLEKEFADWNDYNEELMKQSFDNPENEYFYDYSRLNIMVGLTDAFKRTHFESPSYKLKLIKEKIDNCLTYLKRLIEKLRLIEEQGTIIPPAFKEKSFNNTCFMVHGHDELHKHEIARFIETSLHKKCIILHEQPNKGLTIMEKFESYSKVDFAVAIWTADDVGKAKKDSIIKKRARQNVIFETGFFIGRIRRRNVIVLYENDVEIPSDYSGVIFISLTGNWKDDLRKEVEAIYEIH